MQLLAVPVLLAVLGQAGDDPAKTFQAMETKIAEVRTMIELAGLPVDVEVDGGIAPDTIAGAAAAGANIFVAGSALFEDAAGLRHAVEELRATAEAAR